MMFNFTPFFKIPSETARLTGILKSYEDGEKGIERSEQALSAPNILRSHGISVFRRQMLFLGRIPEKQNNFFILDK